MKQGDLYTTADSKVFVIEAIWNPNEENDPWVRYRSHADMREYTCRQEAFLSRFSPLPN
jgi:hypothetical protein